jgi:opacity protein-like surface antigen
MKLIQIIVAASILMPAVSSFAQSTPPAVNGDVRGQLVQAKPTYQSFDSNDQKQAAMNTVRRNGGQSRQIAGVNVGRYSMSVVGPAF